MEAEKKPEAVGPLTSPEYDEVLPVQIYAKTQLDRRQLEGIACSDPYRSEIDRVELAKLGVVFFRDGQHTEGAVVDAAFTGTAFYTQAYVKDDVVSTWFILNEPRNVILMKKESVTFRF